MINRKRWQIVSDDSVWMFPADTQLSTVEMREDWKEMFDYQYESCIFPSNDESFVVARYDTQEEAIIGHEKLEKKYGLKRCLKLKI